MANMTFKANLMPDNAAAQRELGSSEAKWKINGYFPVVNISTTGTGSFVTGIENDNGEVTVTKDAGIVISDENVSQTNTTANFAYRILLSGNANDTTETTGTNKSVNLQFNPSTKIFSVGGDITTTGDIEITGDAYLNSETYADSITADSLLVNGAASFVVSPTAPTPDSSSNDTTIATTAFVKNNIGGLSGAMHFKGTTTTTMTDGLSTANVDIGGSSYTPEAGDVVLYSDREFVWTGILWEMLGADSSFKTVQTAVTTATTASADTATTFVSAIEQDANGVIQYTTKVLPTYTNYEHPTATSAEAAAVKVGRDSFGHVVLGSALTASDVGAASSTHTHGNITNDGKVGTTANYAIYTTTSGAVTASSLAVTAPTASGSATAFISSVSQDSKGQISATKANLPTASTATAGIIKIGSTVNDAAAGDHTHTLSIATNNGTSDITLAYGTKYQLTAGGNTYIFEMPASDNSDTHRPIQVNSTEILGDNTTALNFIAGDGISITNSVGSVTITGTVITIKDWTVT